MTLLIRVIEIAVKGQDEIGEEGETYFAGSKAITCNVSILVARERAT